MRKSSINKTILFFLGLFFLGLIFLYLYNNSSISNRINVSLSSTKSNTLGIISRPEITPTDTSPPNINIIAPDKEVFSKISLLRINIYDENLDKEVHINNRVAYTDNEGLLEFPFDVIDGKNIFEIEAKDTFKNKSVRRLELDLTIGIPKKIPILMYHHINSNLVEGNSVHEVLFAEQLDWLNNLGYSSITFSQLNDYLIYGFALPPNPILLSFDDGYIDNYYNAFKILVNKGMKGSFGIIPNLVGTDAHGGRFYMSWDELREMNNEGMELINHSLNHKYLPGCSNQEIEQEILVSKRILETFTNKKNETFIYPIGGYNKYIIEKLKEFGYKSARTNNDKNIMNLENIYILPVIKVPWGTTPEDLGILIKNSQI